ncbi:oxidoreductase [Virgisporangium aliadipatigenens]|uniref:Oxidoreductase n=1 Tax=Virgisporangium aliadipatigenens TaxID=741659 RepID=A0A8J3YQ67_9ACTN|nr:molybdopterin-dependent oxidoreductase [Virgisporangium aliadipatigenens]GIJ47960.1 oxidoreductase [Virgisporangium aliadipatigenens]
MTVTDPRPVRRRPGLSPILRGAAVGLLTAGVSLAVARFLSALLEHPESGPVLAVGSFVIDHSPRALKEFAIRTFGAADKLVLLSSVYVGLAAAAIALGRVALRWGLVALGAFGALGAAAVLTRPGTSTVDILPTLAGVLAGALALCLLRRAARTTDVHGGRPRLLNRRQFLATAGGAAVVAAGTAAGARALSGRAGTRSRAQVRLPAPADPAPPRAPGVDLGIDGVAPWVTPVADFYRVDTALSVPQVDVGTWRLRLRGAVERPATFTFEDLLRRPLIERDITLNCVSNEVGGPYVGSGRWLGVPLAPLLREAGIRAGQDQLVSTSVEGMTTGTPLAAILDGRDAMLALGLNGEPLPLVNGFPVRLLVPGLYGYVGACKWVSELRVTTFDRYDAYWVERGWAADAPVKTASRIDTPKPFARLGAGPVTVAGVAWAQRRGIGGVEVRVDDGPWLPARLADGPTPDTWRQWVLRWDATPGPHTLRVRAADGSGAVQPEERATPFPSGATGWHTVTVTVD